MVQKKRIEDIFKKGSTVYEVEMNVVSDQKEQIGKWDAGLKVYYKTGSV